MTPPVIIGGGPAGTAAAAVIAAAGHPVTVIERNAGPADKMCGDFLSGGAVAALRTLGIDPLSCGAAPLLTIRLVHRGTVAEAPLPFPAFGLSRRSLDEALLQAAAQRGAQIRRGLAVRGVETTAAGFILRTASEESLSARTVFLANGKHDLRRLARPRHADGLLALKMYFDLAPDQQAELHGGIELMLLNGGYAGLQRVENNRAVLCMLVPATRYRRAGGRWDSLLAELCREVPLLERRLTGAVACLAQPLAIAGTPYGHLYRPPRGAPRGLFRLGDQACVVPSFAGDGVAIALHSGMDAAAAWLRGDDARRYHADLVRHALTPMRCASLLHAVCRSPAAQPLIAAACRSWPAMLRAAASLTRVARAA